MGLFKEEQGNLIIDPEIKQLPVFAKLIKGGKGKEKGSAVNLLMFIYMMYDYKSPYHLYSEAVRQERLLKTLRLKKEDISTKEFKEAAAAYIELSQTPAALTLTKTKETLIASIEILGKIRNKIEAIINEPVDSDKEIDHLSGAIVLINKTLSLAEQLPKTIQVMEDLEEKVKKESLGTAKIRGGGSINPYEL